MLDIKYPKFRIRNAKSCDLDQLVWLEQEWPKDSRASKEVLALRLEKFPAGFFIAEDNNGIIASIICCPYDYQPHNLSNFKNWALVAEKCYQTNYFLEDLNSLYIISGTSKKFSYGNELFDAGVNAVVKLAEKMAKKYVVGGALLLCYKKFLGKNAPISATDYVFKQSQGRFVEPLIEKYRRLGFIVPNEEHVIADYFPDKKSLNYSALVVKNL